VLAIVIVIKDRVAAPKRHENRKGWGSEIHEAGDDGGMGAGNERTVLVKLESKRVGPFGTELPAAGSAFLLVMRLVLRGMPLNFEGEGGGEEGSGILPGFSAVSHYIGVTAARHTKPKH